MVFELDGNLLHETEHRMSAEIFVTKQGSIGFARAGNLVIFVAEDNIRESDWQ